MTAATTVINPAEALCEASHDSIISGRSGVESASFGAFIADLPVGAEILSVSGRRARWTGEYAMAQGHRAAVLAVLDRPELGTITIHTCGMNHWTATGRGMGEAAPVRVAHNRRYGMWGLVTDTDAQAFDTEGRPYIYTLRNAAVAALAAIQANA